MGQLLSKCMEHPPSSGNNASDWFQAVVPVQANNDSVTLDDLEETPRGNNARHLWLAVLTAMANNDSLDERNLEKLAKVEGLRDIATSNDVWRPLYTKTHPNSLPPEELADHFGYRNMYYTMRGRACPRLVPRTLPPPSCQPEDLTLAVSLNHGPMQWIPEKTIFVKGKELDRFLKNGKFELDLKKENISIGKEDIYVKINMFRKSDMKVRVLYEKWFMEKNKFKKEYGRPDPWPCLQFQEITDLGWFLTRRVYIDFHGTLDTEGEFLTRLEIDTTFRTSNYDKTTRPWQTLAKHCPALVDVTLLHVLSEMTGN